MMMRRNRRNRDGAKDETEALQTDVMRFLAIICMCLMIIFALVQSLPRSEPATASKEVSGSDERAVQKAQKAKEKVQKLTEAANALDRKIQTRQKRLARLEKKVEEAGQQTAAQKVRKNPEKAVLAQLEQKMEAIKLKKKQAQAKQEMENKERKKKMEKNKISQTNKQPPVKEEKKEGFRLAFSSDKDFAHLLSTRQNASLYLFARENCWKLSEKSSGRYQFRLSDPPGQVYDMQPDSVPSAIERAAGRIRSVYGNGNVTYGVSLPSGIQHKIKTLMAERGGGSIVIDGNGHIRMKEAGK